MRLLIDTNSKTIEVKQEIVLEDLITKLKEIFPKDWFEYKIVSFETTSVPVTLPYIQIPNDFPNYPTIVTTTY